MNTYLTPSFMLNCCCYIYPPPPKKNPHQKTPTPLKKTKTIENQKSRMQMKFANLLTLCFK